MQRPLKNHEGFAIFLWALQCHYIHFKLQRRSYGCSQKLWL